MCKFTKNYLKCKFLDHKFKKERNIEKILPSGPSGVGTI